MLLVDDDRLAERACRLRNLGFQPDRRFVHAELGFNFRLTNLQAALGLAQIDRMDEIVARKRRIGQAYTERLSEMPGIERTSSIVPASTRATYGMSFSGEYCIAMRRRSTRLFFSPPEAMASLMAA